LKGFGRSPVQMASKPTPVIIDCDTGVDDALALLLACKSKKLDVLAVTCVAGNGPLDLIVDATTKVLDAAGAPMDLPVAAGFAEPLIESTHYAPFIHGKDCLGDLEPELPKSDRKVASEHATQVMLRTLEAADPEVPVTVIALAPLTNVAVAIRLNPDLWKRKVGRIMWMGGAVRSGGNYKAWSEANACYDPEATQITLSSGIPITMYPWDAFINVEFTRTEIEAFEEACAENRQAQDLAVRIFEREMRIWDKPTAVLGDAGAVACLLDPSVANVKACHVTCELRGEATRGMTVCDLREFVDPPDLPQLPPNVDVIMDVDSAAIKRVFVETVFNSVKE